MKRLFVDMDGTLSVFLPQENEKPLYEQGYFRHLPPQENVIKAVKQLYQMNQCEVYILSAYLADSPYALHEKKEWLHQYIPEIPESNYFFVTCGRNKKEVVFPQIGSNDYLLDDYTKNLMEWSPGTGIKLLNGINHTRGTWKGAKIKHDLSPETMIQELLSIMHIETHQMPKNVPGSIGERIKQRRELLAMSQDELAKKLGYKSSSSINKIESNQNNLTLSKIKAMADALETTPYFIMGWEKSDE